MGCSFQFQEKTDDGEGSISIQLPSRGTTGIDDPTFSKIRFVLYDENEDTVVSENYNFGETISVKNLKPGLYYAEILCDNSNNFYFGSAENIEINLGETTKCKIELEKAENNIGTKLGNLGTIDKVLIPTEESFILADYSPISKKLYIFSEFNQNFISIISDKDFSSEITTSYNTDISTIKNAIEMQTYYSNSLPTGYTMTIIYNGKACKTYISKDDFDNLTLKLDSISTAKTTINNFFNNEINSNIEKLGEQNTSGSNITLTVSDNQIIPGVSFKENYVSSKRLYAFSGKLNDSIGTQLQQRKSNCDFNFSEAQELKKQKKAFIQISATYNLTSKQLETFEIRFKDVQDMPYGNYGPGYSINNIPLNNFKEFLLGSNNYTFPEKGSLVKLSSNSISGFNNDIQNPEATQFTVEARNSAQNQILYKGTISLDKEVFIPLFDCNNVIIDVVGSDSESIYIGSTPVSPDQVTPLEVKQLDTKLKTKLSHFGTINKIRSCIDNNNINRYEQNTLFEIKKLYSFNDFNSDFIGALEGKNFDKLFYNNYGIQYKDMDKCMIELVTFVNQSHTPADATNNLTIDHYSIGIKNSEFNSTQERSYAFKDDYINPADFENFINNFKTINTEMKKLRTECTKTGGIDEKLSTLGTIKEIKEHNRLNFINYNNENHYTRLYAFETGTINKNFTNQLANCIPNTYNHFEYTQTDYIQTNIAYNEQFKPTTYELRIKFENMKKDPDKPFNSITISLTPERWQTLLANPAEFTFAENEIPGN